MINNSYQRNKERLLEQVQNCYHQQEGERKGYRIL